MRPLPCQYALTVPHLPLLITTFQWGRHKVRLLKSSILQLLLIFHTYIVNTKHKLILQNANKLKTEQNTKYPKKFRCTLFRLQPQKEEKMKWPIYSWS